MWRSDEADFDACEIADEPLLEIEEAIELALALADEALELACFLSTPAEVALL